MRLPRLFRPPVVGLDMGSDAVKAVILRRSRGAWTLIAAAEAPMPETGTSDPDAAAEALKQVFDTLRVRRGRIAAALSGHAAIVKRLSLPPMTEAELAEAIPWEAEQYIPFDLADVQLDYQVLTAEPGARTTEVLLVAAKKERIDERAEAIVRAGRQPVILDLEAFALVNAYEANHPERADPLTVIVHTGRVGTIVCLLERGQLAFTRDIALGGQTHTEALMRDLDVEPATAERLKHPGRPLVPGVDPNQVSVILREVTGQLVAEIRKSIDFYRATAPIERVSRVVLSGGACDAEGLSELLAAEFEAAVEIFDPFHVITRSGRRPSAIDGAGPAYAVAVGLAMRMDGAA
ncbi:MAG: type IV pilus assembly protein PilM [Acidobacteria bacterium]|nr:type IV pilus assembly protein PilM [Acidobacteriota bacterium]